MPEPKDFKSLKENIIQDIKEADQKQLDAIYSGLRSCLSTFDRDNRRKNAADFFKLMFKSKQRKCLLVLEDICDSDHKLSAEEKEALRKEFLDISNIHRTFWEDLLAL